MSSKVDDKTGFLSRDHVSCIIFSLKVYNGDCNVLVESPFVV